MKSKSLMAAIFFAFSFHSAVLAAEGSAPDCGPCHALKAAARTHRVAFAENERVLRSTQQYIAEKERSPSRGLAARSNIVILQLRLETFRNELEYVESSLERRGCGSCGH
jgi:hypothetical protein